MTRQTENISAVNIAQFIAEKTDRNLFLTGKAGTGKTMFLKEFKEHTKKKVVVLAPTGIAAINAKAQTIHSFFKFSFSPYIPETININTQDDAESYDDEILKVLDMIIIDEISMVRADMLDRIDNKLRRVRRSDKCFGGVQLLMIGDLFQLPPIASKDDKAILKNYYGDNYYFINSTALKKVGFETICLDKVYRQNDEDFIKILEKARIGKLNWPCINKLNTRFLPDFETEEDSRYINIVALKRDADRINKSKLNNIDGSDRTYTAIITGTFAKDSFPSPELLSLKVGAQVMFTRNSYQKGYRNGTIGMVTNLDEDYIMVKVDGNEIMVERCTWDNTEYTLIDESREIREESVGHFTQFPLKPAWAITVHKSQGLTFDNAVINLPYTFESGQAYVAFSRCRTLNGIVLKSKVHPGTFIVDNSIVNFYNSIETNLERISEKVAYVPFEWDEDIEDSNDDIVGNDTQLAEKLKEWRLAKSREHGLLAFQILNNRALNNIVTIKPRNVEQLGYIDGVKLNTVTRFGEDIVKIVNGSSLDIQPDIDQVHTVANHSPQIQKKSWEITYDMYCSGMSVTEIANERGLTLETIYNHLLRYVESGELDAHNFVSEDIINKVRQFKMDNPDSNGLKPIFEALDGNVSYDEIRFALKCL